MLKSSFLVLLIISAIGYGQTKAIAFKSHSGNPAYFNYEGDGNFGMLAPRPRLDSIVKFNDSTIIHYNNTIDGPYFYDTMHNHPFWNDPQLNIDSLKKGNYRDVEFIGFAYEFKCMKRVHAVKAYNKRAVQNSCTKPLTVNQAITRIKKMEVGFFTF